MKGVETSAAVPQESGLTHPKRRFLANAGLMSRMLFTNGLFYAHFCSPFSPARPLMSLFAPLSRLLADLAAQRQLAPAREEQLRQQELLDWSYHAENLRGSKRALRVELIVLAG